MIPAYERVYQALKRNITDGEYKVGDLLPPEPELEKMFLVSRTTVRRAIGKLSSEKFVSVKQGKGTEVIDYKTKQNLNKVTSISETLRRKGISLETRSMHIDRVEASSANAELLGVETGSELVRIQRVQITDGHPIAIMKNYLPPKLVPGIEQYKNTFSCLYSFLKEVYGIKIDSAADYISARPSSFTESEILQIKTGSSLLVIKRICYQDGRPVILDRVSLIGDKYEFEIFVHGRSE